ALAAEPSKGDRMSLRSRRDGPTRLQGVAVLAALAALAAGCAGGVQHSYPAEHATSDRFDPRPDPDEKSAGLFTGEGWKWVRDLGPGDREERPEPAAAPAESSPAPEIKAPDAVPPVGQDPGPDLI
ncbi:MAG: hypothetical protein AAGL49_12085, partial [Pseudomonadota bacterium]